MTHEEQKKMIEELRDYMHKMSRTEEEAFQMYVKRKKDDEDLDNLSQKKLAAMFERYVVNRVKRI
jgi:type III secretory pathway component EscR